MPDLPNRRAHEERLTAAMLLLFRRHQDAIARGDALRQSPPDEMVDALADTHRTAAAAMLTKHGLPPEPVGAVSRQWAEGYASALAMEVTDTTRQHAASLAGPLTPEVLAALWFTFRHRASTIGVTETTRAVTAGEGAATTIIDALTGETLVGIWYTENDARVCEVCGPLHGTGPEVYSDVNEDGPPAHPNCRCWLEYEPEAFA